MEIYKKLFKTDSLKIKGSFFIVATILGNFFNFAYNAYLGRTISLEDFALISLIGSFLGFADIPINALGRSMTHRSAYLFGKYKKPAEQFWRFMRKRSFLISIVIATVWTLLIPFLQNFFHLNSSLPLLAVTPIWVSGIMAAVDGGFVKGNLRFGYLAIVSILEALIRFLLAILLVESGMGKYVYFTLPISSASTFFLVALFANKLGKVKSQITKIEKNSFPFKFFASTALTKISATFYLTFDVILAKHFLLAEQAGQYALLSLTGKMVYFSGSLFSQFILPIVSHSDGARKNSHSKFLKLLFGTFLASFIAYIFIGILGFYSMPLLFGNNSKQIINLIPWYAGAMVAFTVATNIVAYHQIKGRYILPVISFLLAISQIFLIFNFHSDVEDIANVMVFLGFASLIATLLLHFGQDKLNIIVTNLQDFLDLFNHKSNIKLSKGTKILIYNWRDSKHTWAGGAEVYVEELAKRWVKQGNSVTLFCGNDGKSKRNEQVKGINIIRRGGFFTVYLWAVLYYFFKFRNRFDVIVDSENGIPFFSTLFSRKPIILLIHHVHQEIFLEQLSFPLSRVAKFVEGKIMPYMYRSNQVITVSNSSKNEIVRANLAKEDSIRIINPGIEIPNIKTTKTKQPSFIYLGRLKPYKNVDVAIKSFSELLNEFPEASLSIVGEGESAVPLKNLTNKLSLTKQIVFWGRVTNRKKLQLLSQSWVAIQPSSVEGWGITVLEANACGTPVIASRVNGLKDSIIDNETGILVQVKNVNALKKAMKEMITNPKKRKNLTKNAFSWSRKYSWDVSSEEFLRVLESEISQKDTKSFRTAFNLRLFNRN